MMTMDRQYELMVGMARTAYDKLGWDHEQAPMIFTFDEDGKFDVYLIPTFGVDANRGKDMINALHQKLAQDKGSAVLMMEAWAINVEKEEAKQLTGRLANDPRREEVLMINIRCQGQQRIGMIKLDRQKQQLTPGKLSEHQMLGRFVDHQGGRQ
jgi:hypothetical protein